MSTRRDLVRYAAAVCSVAGGLLLRFALEPVLGTNVPYITFFPAVMLASWFGGLGPGLLATFLSLAAAVYNVIPPIHTLRVATRADLVGGALFAVVSVFIAVLNEALLRSRARNEERLRQFELEAARRISAEAQLEERTREAERDRDLLRITLSSIGDAVISADAEGRVTFLNNVARELTGWTHADAAGTPISEVFVVRNEQTGIPVDNPAERAIREGVIVGLANHTVLVSRDGREIPIEDSAAPICEGNGRVVGVVLIFRDVTAHRRSEAALQRSEERLTLALGAGQIGVWDWDIVKDRIEWSELVYDIHGVARGSFGGGVEEFARLIHPDDRDRINESIRAALEMGSPYDVEFRVIHPDGNVRWVATTGTVLRNDRGEPIRMLGATSDVTARKQVETNLLQQWHTFDTALSNTPDFTYIFDLDGRFTYVNRGLLSLLQRSLADVTGKNFFDLEYPADLAARLQRQIQQVIDTREPLRDQTPFTGPSGEGRQYEYIFVPVLGPGGRVDAVTGSTRDITERSRAEDALRKSEERLTFALEAGGGVGTWDWDVPEDRIYCNPQFARLYSVDPERAAAGASIAEFTDHIHPGDQERVRESIRQAIQKCGDLAEEYRIIQRDGSVRWVYVRGRCHADRSGHAGRFPGVAFDVTERKRGEEALRESQGRLRAMYDGTYEYIGLLATDGTLLEANRASLTFANNTREEVVGRPFWGTPWFSATPGVSDAVREGVARAARGEFVRFEATVYRPTGEHLTFDISLHPIRNEQGEVVLIVPEGRDITERKRAEEDLRHSNEELKRVNRELEEFAYVASHDLQEPLRMVNIYTQLILEELGPAGARLEMYAGFVQQGVKRMEALINDLLTFSRTVYADELKTGVADLSDSLRDALAVLANRMEESNALIVAQALPKVRGDTSQMAQVFQNLISNALKYRRNDVRPEIDISAQWDGNNWIISVRDNGIGFEQHYADRIFGLFKRLHREEYPGTGLGLAICRRVVERYGGRIWAEGIPGEGAAFHFSLPGPT